VSTIVSDGRLAELVADRERLVRDFVVAEQEPIARACHAIARAHERGGTLIPYGAGSAATDAAHAAVEFMHPIIVGKRALPALAPSNDPTGASSAATLCRPDDIALALTHAGLDLGMSEFLETARGRGALTIAMTGAAVDSCDVDFHFRVPSADPVAVQEAQETVYHVFWELVHTFFEHPGLLEDSCITCGDVAVEAEVVAVEGANATIELDGARERVAIELLEGVEVGDTLLCHAGVALEKLSADAERPPEEADDPSGFLYPFLGRSEHDLDTVLRDARASTVRKAEDVIELRRAIDVEAVEACARNLRVRLDAGARILTFGNGGSATDAQDLAADALARGWPAACLTNDSATVTAVGNDVGFDKVFSRQLIPLARAGDIAFAITTSGNSANVIAGLEEARRRELLTCAIAGYDGGRLAGLEWLDHLFVVASDYVPRLQEAQATIYHLLLEAIGERR